MVDDTTTAAPAPEPALPEGKTFQELIMYKIDRTLAIVGIVAIGIISMTVKFPEAATQVVNAAIGALAVYIGGRTVSK